MIFQNGWTTCARAFLLLHTLNSLHIVLFYFNILAILVGRQLYFNVTLICSSLLTSKMKTPFKVLLAIWLTPFISSFQVLLLHFVFEISVFYYELMLLDTNHLMLINVNIFSLSTCKCLLKHRTSGFYCSAVYHCSSLCYTGSYLRNCY